MHDETTEPEQVWDFIDDIPVAPTIKVLRPSKYGSVPGLDDEELADPEELERMVEWELWGPVLALPRLPDSDNTRA